MEIKRIAYFQGIADWLRYKFKCPVYWRGTSEETYWKRGQRFASEWGGK
jgi:hypothetical protein